jgi:hypothetical protein
MPTALAVDRTRVCTFTFANGCQCRIPLAPHHPYLCTFHARREADDRAAQEALADIAFPLSHRYVSHGDLSSAIANTMTAVACNHISSRTANTMAYLSQNLLQALTGAEHEFKQAFGTQAWREIIADNYNALRPSELRDQSAALPHPASTHPPAPPKPAAQAANQEASEPVKATPSKAKQETPAEAHAETHDGARAEAHDQANPESADKIPAPQ